VSLTHTPNPMECVNEILGRPPDVERPFLLMVVDYPADGAQVSDIERKSVEQVVASA
jgi:iodotyrosine deiodinase